MTGYGECGALAHLTIPLMRTPIYQLDAFTRQRFAGNPAAVMPMEQFPADILMQTIAAENNLAETAFVVRDGSDYRIRWFTPKVEVPLCGHATLASAAVIMERLEPTRTNVIFHSASGPLPVRRTDDGYVLNFPARLMQPVEPPPALLAALGVTPLEVRKDAFNHLALLGDADTVRNLKPNFAEVVRLDRPGLIVTAAGDGDYDCVSRYFAPAKGVDEDPVTGGAHCALAPFWAEKLGKTNIRAYQASARGGDLACRLQGDRVELAGGCVFFLEGMVEL